MKFLFKKRSPAFYRYLFSYALAFFLPLICVGVFIYGYFLSAFQKEVISNSFSKLNQTMLSMDFQLTQIKSISEQIFSDPKFLPFNFERDNVSGIHVSAELKKYALSSNFLSEVLFYCDKSENYLFSSATSYTVDNFFYLNRYRHWSKQAFLEDMKKKIPMVRSEEPVDLYVNPYTVVPQKRATFLFPDPNYYMERQVIITVNAETFQKFQQNNNLNYPADTFLLDENNRLIFSSDSGMDSEKVIENIAFDQSQDFQSKKLDGREYFCFYIKSPKTGYTYLTVIDAADALRPVRDMKLIFIGGMLLLLVFGSLIVAFFTHHSYAPLRGLRDSVKTALAGTDADEFVYVSKAIRSLQNKNQQLSSQLEDSADAVKTYLLYNLLKGSIASREQFNEKGKAYGLTLDRSNLMVIMFHNSTWSNEVTVGVPEISHILPTLLPDGVQGYIREHTTFNALLFILCFDDDWQSDEQEAFLSRCKTACEEILKSPVTVGVSEQDTDIAAIPKLYIQASTAINYRLLKGVDHIIYYRDLVVNQSIIDKSFLSIRDKLSTLIRAGNCEQIAHLLDNTIAYMKHSNTSIFLAKMVCYDIIHTMMQTIDELRVDGEAPPFEYPSIFSLSTFETVDELVAIVKKISKDVSDYFNQDKQVKGELIDDMKAYVRERYTSADFSTQVMADAFGMNGPNLSTYFKKKTGLTILDFVTRLKIAKAKELLETSKLPVRDIALEVGYENITSFIRRFKQLTGMTPGEYKNLHS